MKIWTGKRISVETMTAYQKQAQKTVTQDEIKNIWKMIQYIKVHIGQNQKAQSADTRLREELVQINYFKMEV